MGMLVVWRSTSRGQTSNHRMESKENFNQLLILRGRDGRWWSQSRVRERGRGSRTSFCCLAIFSALTNDIAPAQNNITTHLISQWRTIISCLNTQRALPRPHTTVTAEKHSPEHVHLIRTC